MADKTGVCNLALSHVGVSKEIANVDTENSASASACRRFYDKALNEIFEDFSWPFANKFAALGLVEEDPNNDWGYSYRYPSDCKRLLKILSGIRNDSRQTKVSYELGSDSSGILIFTDEEDAEAKYTEFVTDTSFYPTAFEMMLSLLLAAYIAPRVTGGDPFKLGVQAFQKYSLSQSKAQANALNEQAEDEPVEAESIRARE